MNLTIHGLNIDATWAQIQQLPEPRRPRARRWLTPFSTRAELCETVASQSLRPLANRAADLAFDYPDKFRSLDWLETIPPNAYRKRRQYDFWVSSYRQLITEVETRWATRTPA